MGSDCEACQRAQNGFTGLFYADCTECKARMLSQSLPFWSASKQGKMTPEYRNALDAAFGDWWKAGHEMVKAKKAEK